MLVMKIIGVVIISSMTAAVTVYGMNRNFLKKLDKIEEAHRNQLVDIAIKHYKRAMMKEEK